MSNKINCPNCSHEFAVEEALSGKLESHIRAEYESKINKQLEKFKAEREQLSNEKKLFEDSKQRENEIFKTRLTKKLKEESIALEKKIKDKIQEEQAEQIQVYEKELREQSEKVKELNRSKAEIERLKREKEELKEVAQAEAQKLLNEQIAIEKEKIRKVTQEEVELKIRELHKQLEDQKS